MHKRLLGKEAEPAYHTTVHSENAIPGAPDSLDHPGDLFGLPEPPQGDHLLYGVLVQLGGHVALDEAGAHGIHRHASSRELPRHRHRHADHTSLWTAGRIWYYWKRVGALRLGANKSDQTRLSNRWVGRWHTAWRVISNCPLPHMRSNETYNGQREAFRQPRCIPCVCVQRTGGG